MKDTPYGYDIVQGKAVVNDRKAAELRMLCENYLSGMSLENAAKEVGIAMKHSSVKRLLTNRRYLGDEYYPAILTKEMFSEVSAELKKRAKALGRDSGKRKEVPKGTIYTCFSAPRILRKYEDPAEQAEYAYSQIRNEVK